MIATFSQRVIRKIYRVYGELSRSYNTFLTRSAPVFVNPTHDELQCIERNLCDLGLQVEDYAPDTLDWNKFRTSLQFPAHYHGGAIGGVYDEKLLEHFIAYDLLGLSGYGAKDVYFDVAAGNSPWVLLLRNALKIEAYAIDLTVGDSYKDFPYYQQQDATSTNFAPSSVRGISLQCAFEMFIGGHDSGLIKELFRVLMPGGKCIISPLYMHTHYCGYSTPEYFRKGYADKGAIEYVRRDCWGIPFSRKYDAIRLKERVLDEIKRHGGKYRLLALRNKQDFGNGIYCHFILEIEK